ncbi:hypothetical protein RISK_002916 [Rhodopirellula islandica]|uniref:Uncharacterized protein n=1 Tax=Rhodopirellula islandica TaxID=595434 RepID=A0A0J1EHY2_RHOIS|nr:hypothetical protein RISK_002916 [Rhodopirellula islandica]
MNVSGGGSHRHARDGWRSKISDPESVPAGPEPRKPRGETDHQIAPPPDCA